MKLIRRKNIQPIMLLLIMLMMVKLSAINQMDLIMTLSGEYIGCEYGASIVSLDFNGDGYDDLIVKSPLWHPTQQTGIYENMYGKVYFYWGGPDFDDLPDFVIEGQYPHHFSGNTYSSRENPMINAGDMNGDGIDDLVIPQRLADGTRCVAVYFGRAIPQSNPDVELHYPYPDTDKIFVYPLGDINGDGKDDVSITLLSGYTLNYRCFNLIWTDILDSPVLFRTSVAALNLCGVGDVNGDGFADMVHYDQVGNDRSFTFYYGDQSCSMADSLLLGSSGQVTTYYSSALGDVNGDGYADFLSFIDKIWLGSSPVSNTPSLLLDYGNFLNFEYGMWPAIVHGDFNGDGFEDFAASDNRYAGNSGQAGIWLGKQNMNGTRDLSIDPPANYRFRNFGWSKAAGDFNGDGYCDLAFSAPIFDQGDTWNTAGKVFIYAGNALLSDTTVANEDEVLPPPQLSIRVFPNPLRREEIVQMEIKTISAPQGDQAILRIFNARGQQIYHQEHITLSGKSTILPLQLQDLANGVYLCQLQHGHTVTTTKFTIMI